MLGIKVRLSIYSGTGLSSRCICIYNDFRSTIAAGS